MRSMPPKDSDNTEASTFEDCFPLAWLLGKIILEFSRYVFVGHQYHSLQHLFKRAFKFTVKRIVKE
jgi:hypothetical protein